MVPRGMSVVLATFIAAVLSVGAASALVLERRARAAGFSATVSSRVLSSRGPGPEEDHRGTGGSTPPIGSPSGTGVSPFLGLAAWVDAFDYAPAYYRPPEGRQLVPEDVDAIAAQGVRTLFLQAARSDDRSPEGIVDRALVGRFLTRAHGAGLQIVAWYLPKFGDLSADLANLLKLRDFAAEGQRFDAIAVDIEYRGDVADPAERSRRLVELSRRLREAAPGYPLGAIVYPPVLLDSLGTTFWPDFPWRDLAGVYDAWLPMAYWTELSATSRLRDTYRYASEAARGVRAALGDASALVHVIGGVADAASVSDVASFVCGAREAGAAGWSLYDYRTTSQPAWETLREQGVCEVR